MTPVRDRIVFITGASSGIGKSCAYAFASAGAHVIIAARRLSILEEIATDIREKHGVRVLPIRMDVRNRSEVFSTVEHLPAEWREIDILVNNAGVPRGLEKLHHGDPDDWAEMIDTNITGLLLVTRAVLPGMVERGRGHIINIGSIAGHEAYPMGAVYNATKFAVDAITKSLRMDLVDTPLRVSTVDPGLVETNFSVVRFHGDVERARKVYEGLTPCTPDDVAEAVLFCATRPPHVSINQIVIMPTAQASAMVVHRLPSL
ncbi:MAG: SDR family oxidoreductase [Bacteroidota bacterium]|nr:SDR family oxidoreductase [Bacteroidota bacterium]